MKNKARPVPAVSWIEQNIVPNADLFGPGQRLILEVAGVQTKLNPSEYKLRNNQYLVPVRTVMERIGAEVKWDQSSGTAGIKWGDVRVTIDTRKETITGERGGSSAMTSPVAITRSRSSIWIPLRTLLDYSGQTISHISTTEQERRIKAL